MKKYLILAVLGFFAANAIADVKIELKGFSNDSVWVSTRDVTGNRGLIPDTVLVAKKGKLALPDVKENTRIKIVPREWNQRKSPAATIYVAPGEKFAVTLIKNGDNQEYKVKGSALQAMVDEFDAKLMSLVVKINGMEKGAERDSLISEYYDVPKRYVEANLDSPIAFYALSRTPVEFAEKIVPKLGQGARNSMFVAYEDLLNRAIKRAHEIEAAKKQTAEGEMAPDFELPTPDGSMLKMSSLRGKWVLVDFWGSWCVWCIKGIPQLKANYEKYKDKMEVLSIACRDKKDKWLAAIEKHQLNWKHVISADVVPGTDKRVEQMFGVEGYPTKLLVNPEGKIVKRCVGEDPAFYDDFETLMK